MLYYSIKVSTFSPHVQPHQELHSVQGDPWVQEVHVHQEVRRVLAYLALPEVRDNECVNYSIVFI